MVASVLVSTFSPTPICASAGSAVVVVLVVDGQQVVARPLHRTLSVGQRQSIVGVERVGEDALLHVVDGVARGEAVAVVALEECFRGLPVGLAMRQPVGVAVVFVCEVVETDGQLPPTEADDGHPSPVVVGNDLQRPNVGVEDFVALGRGGYAAEGQRGKPEGQSLSNVHPSTG